MKSTIIEGIPDSKIKRLKKHLLKVEGFAEEPLRKTPRYITARCPIINFAPTVAKDGHKYLFGFDCQDIHGEIWMGWRFFSIYTERDYFWWDKLSDEQRTAITRHIQQWIKEGKKL